MHSSCQVILAAAKSDSEPATGTATPLRDPPSGAPPLALGALYQEHFDFVWRTLRRYGVPEASLDDAVQDTFLVVNARLGGFEGRSSVRTWIFGIARRVSRNHRPKPHREAGAETLSALPDTEGKSPLATLEMVQEARFLEALLARLGPDKREAFILVELEQLTVLEASQALGINTNTISSRVRAARRELEQALARHEAHQEWRS